MKTTHRTSCIIGCLVYCAQLAASLRCAVDNPELVKGGSNNDDCSGSDTCFTLVQYFGETNRLTRHFVGRTSDAFLIQSQGCFKSSAAPLVCAQRKCAVAMSEADKRVKPFQFCCCFTDDCNSVDNVVVRTLEPSMRVLTRNQRYMEPFLRNHTINEDALWARWAQEMFEQTTEEEEEEEEGHLPDLSGQKHEA